MNIEQIITKFEYVKQSGICKWICRCPAHKDNSPSLRVSVLTDGRILLHCFAGCRTEDVVASIGLKMSDLFNDGLDPKDFLKKSNTDFSLMVLAIAKADRENGKKLSSHDLKIEREAFVEMQGGMK